MNGLSDENPLDNAKAVIAAQLLAALMPSTRNEEEVSRAVERALWAAEDLLSQAGWDL